LRVRDPRFGTIGIISPNMSIVEKELFDAKISFTHQGSERSEAAEEFLKILHCSSILAPR
jgi:hypothetical protein